MSNVLDWILSAGKGMPGCTVLLLLFHLELIHLVLNTFRNPVNRRGEKYGRNENGTIRMGYLWSFWFCIISIVLLDIVSLLVDVLEWRRTRFVYKPSKYHCRHHSCYNPHHMPISLSPLAKVYPLNLPQI